MDFRAKKPHPVYIERLALGILFSHENFAFHPHQGGSGSGCDAVLTGSGLGDDTCFSHPFREKNLSEHVVDFVRAGVV